MLDDIAALILLSGLGIEPRLVTVGHGMLPTMQGAAWVRATLDAVGMATVPVVAGGMGPLKEEPWRPRRVETVWRQVQEEMESTFAVMMPGHTLQALAESTAREGRVVTQPDAAARAIFAAAREAESVDILALGSLTNLARAIELDADTFRCCVHRVIFIGDTGGPARPVNVIVDPYAFSVLLKSEVQIFCIGIRAYPHTQAPYSRQSKNQDWTSDSEMQLPALWRDCTGTSISADMLRKITAASRGQCLLYDPLAVACLLRTDMFAFEDVTIFLAADGQSCRSDRGSTICEGRVLEAQSLNWESYRDFLLDAMNQMA